MANFTIMNKLGAVNNILAYGFLIIPTYLLVFTKSNPWMVVPLYLVFILYLSLKHVDKIKKIKIPDYIYFFGIFFVYMNIIGEFFLRLYYTVPYYDKFLHLIVPIYLVFVAKLFIKKETKSNMFLMILLAFTVCILWEIFEYFIDSVSGTTVMRGVFINIKEMTGGSNDTVQDLLFSIIGSIIGGITVLYLNYQNFKKR